MGDKVYLIENPTLTGKVVNSDTNPVIVKVAWNENDNGYDGTFWIPKKEIAMF